MRRNAIRILVYTTLFAVSGTSVLAQDGVQIVPDNAPTNDWFGTSVGIDEDWIVVGAPGDVRGTLTGSVYVFDAASGNQLTQLTALDAEIRDCFGWSVDVSGNTAIIGANLDSAVEVCSGSAYLFDLATGSQLRKLNASDATARDRFGQSVAISGNRAIVGAPDDDYGIRTSTGSAYVFDVTTGEQVCKLTASDQTANAYFGDSVDICGNRAVVGTRSKYVSYLFDITTGEEIAKLTVDGCGIGPGVAISDNKIITSSTNLTSEPLAHLFNAITGEWLMELRRPDVMAVDEKPTSKVAISGELAVVQTARVSSNHYFFSNYVFDTNTGECLGRFTADDTSMEDPWVGSLAMEGNQIISGCSYFDDSGYVHVFTVPEPTVWGLLSSLLGFVMMRRSRLNKES